MLIAGKLRNYLVPFLGASTDVRTVPLRKWEEWMSWRVESRHTRTGGKPKAITLQNEMGMIRECWNWGMENSHLPFSPKLPFQDEDLVTDDKVKRDTWEPDEWRPFARRLREWLKQQQELPQEEFWDCWVAYQMCFSLPTAGCVLGVVKVKRKDIGSTNATRRNGRQGRCCALVQVHKSTKTGARTVNAMVKSLPNVSLTGQHRKRETSCSAT